MVLRMGAKSVELNIFWLMDHPNSSHDDIGTYELVEDYYDFRESFLKVLGVNKLENLEEPTNRLLSSNIELKPYHPR